MSRWTLFAACIGVTSMSQGAISDAFGAFRTGSSPAVRFLAPADPDLDLVFTPTTDTVSQLDVTSSQFSYHVVGDAVTVDPFALAYSGGRTFISGTEGGQAFDLDIWIDEVVVSTAAPLAGTLNDEDFVRFDNTSVSIEFTFRYWLSITDISQSSQNLAPDLGFAPNGTVTFQANFDTELIAGFGSAIVADGDSIFTVPRASFGVSGAPMLDPSTIENSVFGWLLPDELEPFFEVLDPGIDPVRLPTAFDLSIRIPNGPSALALMITGIAASTRRR